MRKSRGIKTAQVLMSIDKELVINIGEHFILEYNWYKGEYKHVVELLNVYPSKIRVRVPSLGEIRIVSISNILEVLTVNE